MFYIKRDIVGRLRHIVVVKLYVWEKKKKKTKFYKEKEKIVCVWRKIDEKSMIFAFFFFF